MSDLSKVFVVPERLYPAFVKKVDRVVRVATRLGVGSITWVKMGERMTGPETRQQKVFDIMICGTAPRLSGWTFVAKLEHLWEVSEDKIIIHNPSGLELPEHYQDATRFNCDQCHKALRRRDTFVVRNDDTADYRQVGRNCLRDFLGHDSPETIINYFQLLTSVMDDRFFDDDESADERERVGGMREHYYFPLTTFLSVTQAMIREFGWCSRRMAAGSGKIATADRVLDKLFDDQYRDVRATDEEVAKANFIIEWFANLDARAIKARDSDYLHNCMTLATIEMLKPHHAGLAASMVAFCLREEEQAREHSASQYVGEVGKREVFEDVEVLSKFSFDGGFGPVVGLVMRQGDNQLIWFASNGAEVECGARLKIKGTIKRHEESRGYKRTVLTRCKILEAR